MELLYVFLTLSNWANAIFFAFSYRNQELKELGELAPHWDNMRKSVIAHCDQMLNMYQDTLAELGKHTGMKIISTVLQKNKYLS